MKTERGCGRESGDVPQTEVLGQSVEVFGAKGEAGFCYLGGAAQRTGMDRKGEGAVMNQKSITICGVLLHIAKICDICGGCEDKELAEQMKLVFYGERKTLGEMTDALIALDKEENPS